MTRRKEVHPSSADFQVLPNGVVVQITPRTAPDIAHQNVLDRIRRKDWGMEILAPTNRWHVYTNRASCTCRYTSAIRKGPVSRGEPLPEHSVAHGSRNPMMHSTLKTSHNAPSPPQGIDDPIRVVVFVHDPIQWRRCACHRLLRSRLSACNARDATPMGEHQRASVDSIPHLHGTQIAAKAGSEATCLRFGKAAGCPPIGP